MLKEKTLAEIIIVKKEDCVEVWYVDVGNEGLETEESLPEASLVHTLEDASYDAVVQCILDDNPKILKTTKITIRTDCFTITTTVTNLLQCIRKKLKSLTSIVDLIQQPELLSELL